MTLKRVVVMVPKTFLSRSDEETEKNYTSRNEAIRAAMNLLLEKLTEKSG